MTDSARSERATLGTAVPSAGARFAQRYRILGRLGRGAVKEVYLAHDERLDREVALALVVGAGPDDSARARVRREAQVTGRLGDHPNVVTVYDAGEEDGMPYLVLRVMPGGSLAAKMAAQASGRMATDWVVRHGREIALALAHAHAHGIVHRDVKPDNVWLTAEGDAALGDFGVAYAKGMDRLTADGAVVGTVLYLSPEQARGDEVGPSADLYALGATLYELLTGRPPFDGDHAVAVITQHLAAAPEPPSNHEPAVPQALDRLVLQLLAKDPADRPPSAHAVADALAGMQTAPAHAEFQRSARGDFVGRDRVMGSLTAAWTGALAGSCRVVALAGEPGIGKTRCAEELARLATGAGAAATWGRCADHEGAPAYRPWTGVLRELGQMPDEGPLEPFLQGAAERRQEGGESPEEARFRMFDAMAGYLGGVTAERPALVILDDLHWADRSSLELLVHVVRELRRARLMILVTYRDGDLSTGHPLRRALGELARLPSFERLEMSGLSPEDVTRFIELTTGRAAGDDIASALHRRTEGNPFFVGEMVRLLDEEARLDTAVDADSALPAAVRDVVSSRLESLPDETRSVLDAAAVTGREFRLTLVADVSGLSRLETLEALEPAVRAHLLADLDPPRCRFTHAIVRDVVYETLAPVRRARLHARIGASLRESRARDESQAAAEVAHHLLQATRAGADPQPALDAAIDAAAEATDRLAYAEAALYYQNALETVELIEAPDDVRRCQLLLGLAQAHRNAGDLEDAQRRYGEAAGVARQLGSPDLLAEAALGYAEWQLYGMVDQPAIDLLRDALERLPDDDSVPRARLLGLLAVRLDPQRDQALREQLLSQAIAMARRVAEPGPLTRLLCLSPLVHWTPESAERRDSDAAETIVLANRIGDHESALWAHTIRYTEAFGRGDMPTADTELEAYGARASELRLPYYRWALTVMRGTRAIFAGRFDEGVELATEAVVHNREHEPDSEQEYTVQMLMLAMARGRPQDADLDLLREFAEQYVDLPMWRAIVSAVEWVTGDAAAARNSFEALARAGFSSPASDPDAVTTLAFAAETCAGLGDVERARTLHDLLEPYGDRNVLVDRAWGAWGAAAHQLGLLAATFGARDAAAGHFNRAVELNRSWNARPWLLRTLQVAVAHGCAPRGAGNEIRALADALGTAPPAGRA